jgi:hypothetical protein
MKTISRRSAAHLFFKRRPGLVLPRQHGGFVAFDGPAFGLLRAEAHRPEQAPDMHLAEAHAVQALDEHANTFERPKLGAEVMHHCTLKQRAAQRRELPGIELRRPASDHRAQCVDAAFIEPRLPGVRGLSRHTDRPGDLGGRLACQHQAPRSHSFACGFVHFGHAPILRSKS